MGAAGLTNETWGIAVGDATAARAREAIALGIEPPFLGDASAGEAGPRATRADGDARAAAPPGVRAGDAAPPPPRTADSISAAFGSGDGDEPKRSPIEYVTEFASGEKPGMRADKLPVGDVDEDAPTPPLARKRTDCSSTAVRRASRAAFAAASSVS